MWDLSRKKEVQLWCSLMTALANATGALDLKWLVVGVLHWDKGPGLYPPTFISHRMWAILQRL